MTIERISIRVGIRMLPHERLQVIRLLKKPMEMPCRMSLERTSHVTGSMNSMGSRYCSRSSPSLEEQRQHLLLMPMVIFCVHISQNSEAQDQSTYCSMVFQGINKQSYFLSAEVSKHRVARRKVNEETAEKLMIIQLLLWLS